MFLCLFSRSDKRCEIPCWYCKDKCASCFTITTHEKYCSDACQNKHKKYLRIFSSLPENFTMKRSFEEYEQSILTLPASHRYLIHTTGSSHNTNGELVSEMTIILCTIDDDVAARKLYVLFQEFKPQRNRLANVGFYVSPENCSVEDPLCAGDLAGKIFVDQLKSPLYNIPCGIKEALKQRGHKDMNSLLQSSR